MVLSLAGVGGGGEIGFGGGVPVEEAVDGGVAYDDLYVLAGFGERNGFDEFRNFVVGALGFPLGDALLACVVGCGGVFGSTGGTREISDIEHAEFNVQVRIEEGGF